MRVRVRQALEDRVEADLVDERARDRAGHDCPAHLLVVVQIRFLEIVLKLHERLREVVADERVGAARDLVLAPDRVELGGRVGRDDLLDVARVVEVEVAERVLAGW